MRVLVQEVKEAKVEVEGKLIASIGRGFLLFSGFTEGDNPDLVRKMADKVIKLRVFPDENGKTNKSLSDVGGEILSVSQFTLYGNVKEGNRPSFVEALGGARSGPLYELFNNYLREKDPSLKTGIFGADMKVHLINDGPFTLLLDSKELFK